MLMLPLTRHQLGIWIDMNIYNSYSNMSPAIMVANPRVQLFPLNCFSLSFYIRVFTLIISIENAPLFNSTLKQFEETGLSTRDQEPTVVPGLVPVSGGMPTPAANVGSICPCDEHTDVCDSSCCCDTHCGHQVALFTGCSLISVSGKKQLCSRNVASYSLGFTKDGYAKLQSSVQRETSSDLFCIRSQNGVDALSHPSPNIPTDSNFDSLFQKSTSFVFSSEKSGDQTSAEEVPAFCGYQYGDIMATAGGSGERGQLWLPTSSVSARCVDANPAAFLVDQSNCCSRQIVLGRDCSTLLTLNMDSFTSIQVLAGRNNNIVPTEVTSVVLQSVEGTQTQLHPAARKNLHPVLLNSTLCTNVVLKAAYVFTYTPAGEIVNVTLSLVIGFIHEAALPLQQEFQISFVQDEVTVHYSGNPGYVIGLPLVSGTMTADGIVRSINARDTISILHSSKNQDCLRNPHKRAPILFGIDFVSGCTLRIEEDANCSFVLQNILDVFRGWNYPQYVASFGNTPLDSILDWLPIRRNWNPQETHSCSIPVSFHLEIQWTKYGSLVNPQAQLVRIQETIQTTNSSWALSPGGSNILPISVSVAFVAASANASPGYRAQPTIDAALPSDFFYPLV